MVEKDTLTQHKTLFKMKIWISKQRFFFLTDIKNLKFVLRKPKPRLKKFWERVENIQKTKRGMDKKQLKKQKKYKKKLTVQKKETN